MRRLVIVILLAGAGLAVFCSLDGPGLTWDEAIYLGFAARYAEYIRGFSSADWFDYEFDKSAPNFKSQYTSVARPWGRFSRPVIDFFWYKGQAHPPLGKLIMAASLLSFSGLVPVLWAMRLATLGEFLVLLFCTYLLSKHFFGRRAGVLSALLLLLMPRMFAHAHIAALDMAVAMMWMAVTVCFVCSKGLPGNIATGVLFGLALLTKMSAAPVFLALLCWVLILGNGKTPRLLCMLLIGPAVFMLFWPAMLVDIPWRVLEYVTVIARRAQIPVYYLGTQFTDHNPPWHYPLLLTLLTIPVATLVLALIGVLSWKERRGVALMLAGLLVIFGIACSPMAPKYDGVRLFLPAFPFVACLAGWGFDRAWRWFWLRARWLALAIAGVILLPQVLGLAMLHPYQLSYYNLLCGGCKGAQALGMETTYWGDTLNRNALSFLNERCGEKAKVAFFPVGSMVPEVHQKVTGYLRKDIAAVGVGDEFDWLVLVARQGMFDETAWNYLRNKQPDWGLYLDGVPGCTIYRRVSEQ